MPSPCSLRLGAVRSHRATEVRALRQWPLALAAGESMKIVGASRRSAAPGSQNIGVAEYGDDLCEIRLREVLAQEPESTVHTVACGSPSIQCPYASSSHARLRVGAREAPRSTPSTLVAAFKREAGNSRLRTQTAPPLSFALFSVAAPHRLRNQPPRAAAELSTHRMPPPSKTAANPSFNLTSSGWLRQPPNAG
jgi:hypothetical protein